MHIFDSRFPFAENAPVVPDATVGDYKRWQNAMGFTRTVVVAPSMYGFDNRCTLDATRKMGGKARCIVTLGPDTPEAEIEKMHADGARGFRYNLARSSINSMDSLVRISERVASYGWHLQLWMHPDGLEDIVPILNSLSIPTVMDHMAGIPIHGGTSHPGYRTLIRLLEAGRTWLKLSLATAWPQLESAARPALNELARTFISAAPDRMLWGSDWPHAMSSVHAQPYPNDALKVDALSDWCADDSVLQRILVSNPEHLYGFPR
ncbi:amidohydrolase family protein [Allopusillimonas soli]|uniref:Amidohydrolase family protein n=1 Tax=Allopusillimonas soli TaxID=659016 RepID=A0A853FE15_9BURK|nr:amidohydrolase family protein [Allopusillimonas soli]NYT38177.1 amidohydrolase family protein [Allopusillimonas soli]